MTPAARVAAAIAVLDDILDGRSAEQALAGWARSSRFAGSKDRAAVRDLVFDALRRRASCAAIGGGLHGRGLMVGLGISDGWDMPALFSGEGHAPAPLRDTETGLVSAQTDLRPEDADDLPVWLRPMWYADLGEAAGPAAQALRARAPLYLRVNMRQGSVDAAAASLLSEGVATVPHGTQPGCLEVTENPRRVKMSQAYQTGLIEIQDAASQIAVAALDIPTGARVLDYCAGGGGKTLALADRFACEVVAHDISAARMQDIPVRAKRAGVTVQLCATDDLAGAAPFDIVVVDAPCSGSGTWRRNPEAKWALTEDKLNAYSALQGDVLASAATYVRPGGRLVYMTCSVFRAENEHIVSGFLAARQGWQAAPAQRLVPGAASDGFFWQVLSAPKS